MRRYRINQIVPQDTQCRKNPLQTESREGFSDYFQTDGTFRTAFLHCSYLSDSLSGSVPVIVWLGLVVVCHRGHCRLVILVMWPTITSWITERSCNAGCAGGGSCNNGNLGLSVSSLMHLPGLHAEQNHNNLLKWVHSSPRTHTFCVLSKHFIPERLWPGIPGNLSQNPGILGFF